MTAAVREHVLHRTVARRERTRAIAASAGVAAGRPLLFAALIGGWAFASGRLVDRQLVSDPAAVLDALWTLVASGRLWPNLAQTVR